MTWFREPEPPDPDELPGWHTEDCSCGAEVETLSFRALGAFHYAHRACRRPLVASNHDSKQDRA